MSVMSGAMSTLLRPVATVRKRDDGWHRMAWMVGNKGAIDIETIYPNKEEAVKAAQAYAEKFHLIFIDPDVDKFISVFFKATHGFIPALVSTKGKTVGKGHAHINPTNAVMEAKQIAKSLELPFEPNFFVLADLSKIRILNRPQANGRNEKPE